MFNRYYEIKNIYKDYIIFIKRKNKYILMENNTFIELLNLKKLKYIKKRNINYLILDNLEILEKHEYENNRYNEYYIKSKLIDIVKYISERMSR